MRKNMDGLQISLEILKLVIADKALDGSSVTSKTKEIISSFEEIYKTISKLTPQADSSQANILTNTKSSTLPEAEDTLDADDINENIDDSAPISAAAGGTGGQGTNNQGFRPPGSIKPNPRPDGAGGEGTHNPGSKPTAAGEPGTNNPGPKPTAAGEPGTNNPGSKPTVEI